LRETTEGLLLKASIFARFGKRAEAEKLLGDVLKSFPPGALDDSDIARVYAALNETEKSFEYLARALESKGTNLTMIKADFRFENIRDDPRFEEILEGLNLK